MRKKFCAISCALIAFGIGCYYRYRVSIGEYKINDPHSWPWALAVGALMLFSSTNIENSRSLKLIAKIIGIGEIGIGIVFLIITVLR